MKYKLMKGEHKDISHPTSKIKKIVRLYRIIALKDFDAFNGNDESGTPTYVRIREGDIGGWVENESNLPHGDSSWVFDNGYIFGDAVLVNSSIKFEGRVYDNAIVKDSLVRDYAKIFGTTTCEKSLLTGHSTVLGHVRLTGSTLRNSVRVWGHGEIVDSTLSNGATVCDNAKVYGCQLSDTALVKGSAICHNCQYSGHVLIQAGDHRNETLRVDLDLKVESVVSEMRGQ